MSPRPAPSDTVGVLAWLDAAIMRHYGQLYRYAIILTGNEADAADLTQQTAVIFARKWNEIREDGAIKSWLYTTLYREFLALQKTSGKTVELDEAMMTQPFVGASEQELHFDSKTALELMMLMDEPHRAVLSLYYVEDMSYREIADVLGVPPGTVMSRLSRAKEVLRTQLSKSL